MTEFVQPPLTLGAFPYYPNNPWQDLIYSDLREAGARVVPIADLEDLTWVDEARHRGDRIVLHVNWTAPVSQIGSIAEASDRVARATSSLAALHRTGVVLIWTVHNVLPHDASHLLPELALCRALADGSDLITVPHAAASAAVQPWYSLPQEKVVELPQPSYVGLYPDEITQEAARERLGVGGSERIMLLFGTLRPYKGIEEAVAAMRAVRAQAPDTRLLITGEIGPGYDIATLERITAGVDGVDLHVGYVGASEVQYWMRAADAMLLPYRAGLNSGVLLLAAGFGLPVIMSESDMSLGYTDAPWVHVIPRGLPLSEGVVDGLRRFAASDPQGAALEAAKAAEPARMSKLFASQVRSVLGRASDGMSGRQSQSRAS